jgi:hypothetical protein
MSVELGDLWKGKIAVLITIPAYARRNWGKAGKPHSQQTIFRPRSEWRTSRLRLKAVQFQQMFIIIIIINIVRLSE